MNIYSDYLRTIEAAMNADTMKMNLNEDFFSWTKILSQRLEL
jgi:hypothetical protein